MSTPQTTRGFTLLEILIASLLASTLLLGLWALLGIYGGLFESGKAKTEQSQLARAVLQQIADDLRSAIQDVDVSGGPLGVAGSGFQTTTTVRRFGLFGDRRRLRCDILQITPQQALLPPEDPPHADDADAPTVDAPELRTVEYMFVPSDETEAYDISDDRNATDSAHRLGLTRRELDFQTPLAQDEDRSFSSLDTTDELNSEQRLAEELLDPSITRLPEVVGLEFRYFDGRNWVGRWDSLQRRSLPVAVEARIEIESFDPRDTRRRAADQRELDREVATVGAEGSERALPEDDPDESPEPSRYGRRTYRMVVHLPGAVSHHGTREQSSGGALPKPRRARPRPPARPRSAPVQPSQQWMRTDAP